MIKLTDIVNEILKEDWFDEYLEFVEKVFDELKTRFNIRPGDRDDIETVFGVALEKGWKNKWTPKKTALAMVPAGQTFKLHRW